ncbi:MAG: hypothetical protein Q9176_000542 [Flavoplaca citrina]
MRSAPTHPTIALRETQGSSDDHFQTNTLPPTSPGPSTSFAPRGFPSRPRKSRRKPPRLLNLEGPPSKGPVARFHYICSVGIEYLSLTTSTDLVPQRALNARLGWTENHRFLEQFRYTIIASQLLNDAPNPGAKRRHASQISGTGSPDIVHNDEAPVVSWKGLATTALAAFAVAWSVHWTRYIAESTSNRWPLVLTPTVAILICIVLYLSFRRQWLYWLRDQASRSASNLVTDAQDLDAQSVAPCHTTGRKKRDKMLSTIDLEKYLDIYDISRSDVAEFEMYKETDHFETSEDLLKVFNLLAISADGGKLDFARWSAATRIMDVLSVETREATQVVDETLGVEKDIPVAITPQLPLTPGRERMRSQMRKLNSLWQGIRGLQARLHLLREDADKLGSIWMHQSSSPTTRYDSIGTELRSLLDEWREGRTVFAANREDSDNRLSLPVMPKTAPSSPTMSLGGSTVVEGSPPDALGALNGYGGPCHRATSSTATSSAGEEVFEAIALPRPKSILSRDERLAKMKEDRIRQAVVKSKHEASTHMLKELETVIKLRPRVLEARLEQAQLLKKVVDAIKDLVQDCNFDCNDSGIALQAMDNSHVALVSMMLKAESFSPFRCDRNIALGINLSSLMKVLRCAQNEDILTLKAEDAPDVVNLVFETSDSDRLSEYDIKLMDIDQEHLGIPETEYAATISMPSPEFQRICRDLMALSESGTVPTPNNDIYACSISFPQLQSRRPRTVSNSHVLAISATAQSLFEATPMSKTRRKISTSAFLNPSRSRFRSNIWSTSVKLADFRGL